MQVELTKSQIWDLIWHLKIRKDAVSNLRTQYIGTNIKGYDEAQNLYVNLCDIIYNLENAYNGRTT